MDIDSLLRPQLDALKADGNYRYFAELERKTETFPRVRHHGADGKQDVTVWCSNDYLGMGQHPAVLDAMCRRVRETGAGAGGTRNISGTGHDHILLEAELADLHGKEAALLFTSGYVANWASLSTLGSRLPNAVILSDSMNHASMIEGMRHSKAPKVIWRHNDPDDLDAKLAALPRGTSKIVAFESVYSMDGDIAPIREIVEVAEKHGAFTYLDEVHAVGMYGYQWKDESTYVQKPPFFDTISEEEKQIQNIDNARPLLLLGNSVTTDHISPAGAIKQDSPAGDYFMERQILQKDFNSYGARRGNHEVMVRGTFANIRIKNELLSDVEGGYSILEPEKKQMSVYEVAMEYQKRAENIVVFAGQEYGTGSSRDWAAKGTKLLGIKAVIAESFERIHRSNLIGMGVLPIQLDNTNIQELGIKSSDLVDIKLHSEIKPLEKISVILKQGDATKELQCTLRIDTINELQYYKSDGILNFVLNNILKN